MKIVYFPDGQGSKDWHEWRRKGIGASDIGIIMGTAPSSYGSVLSLWKDKCGFGKDKFSNIAMEYGKRSEPLARQYLNMNYKWFLESICVEDDDNSIYRASLDGYDCNLKILNEIKAPYNVDNLEELLSGNIRADYYDQVQWQIAITGAQEAYLSIWDSRSESAKPIRVQPDHDRIIALRKAADEFWYYVKMGIEPPGAIEVCEDKLGLTIAEKYIMYDEMEKRGKEGKLSIRDDIIMANEGNDYKAHGLIVTWGKSPATLDKKAMKKDGIDIEKYMVESGKRQAKISLDKEQIAIDKIA